MKDKNFPIFFNYKYECCGCSACYAICPVEAIQMIADEEGFLYPTLEENKCIKCHKCLSVCGFKVKK